MDTGDILECAAQVLGTELTPEQTAVLERCCAAAKLRCMSMLREEPSPEQASVVQQAAGLLAAGLYLDMENTGGEVTSFTAGKLSVTTAGGSGRAKRLKDAAVELLSPISSPESAFLGVRG